MVGGGGARALRVLALPMWPKRKILFILEGDARNALTDFDRRRKARVTSLVTVVVTG